MNHKNPIAATLWLIASTAWGQAEQSIVVENPAVPSGEPLTLQLQERWRIGGDTSVAEELFGTIQQVACDDSGFVYVLDSQLNLLRKFSPDGQFVADVATEGEGPGETRAPISMFFTSEGNIALQSFRRIACVTRDGKALDSLPLPEPVRGVELAQRVGGQLVYSTVVMDRDESGYVATTYLGTSSGTKEIARFAEQTIARHYANFEIEEGHTNDWRRLWQVGVDARIYVSQKYDEYEIDVWSAAGKRERSIHRDYEPLLRSDDEMRVARQAWERLIRGITGAQAVVSRTHRAVERLFPRPDGSLWVLSSRGARRPPQGALAQFDVFDQGGHFVRQVTLYGPGKAARDTVYFCGERVFVVVGDDPFAEEQEIEPNTILCFDTRQNEQESGTTEAGP